MVVHAFNPSTGKAEADGSWSTQKGHVVKHLTNKKRQPIQSKKH